MEELEITVGPDGTHTGATQTQSPDNTQCEAVGATQTHNSQYVVLSESVDTNVDDLFWISLL